MAATTDRPNLPERHEIMYGGPEVSYCMCGKALNSHDAAGIVAHLSQDTTDPEEDQTDDR